MRNKFLSMIDNIERQSNETIYISLLNLFNNIQFAFPIHSMSKFSKPLYRVRTHQKGEDFFYKESDLTFRKDLLNIKSFGRCNTPLQSMFYCSDNNLLSFAEVSTLVRKMEDVDFLYHTTSTWEIKDNIQVSNVLENREVDFNEELRSITFEFFDNIEDPNLIGDKWELKEFLLKMSTIFRREYSKNPVAYMLSSAYSNYLFDAIGENNERIEGLVYPSCLGAESINNIGLNHVFLPNIVGTGKKIELKDVYRSKMELIKDQYYETEIVKCKRINKDTGEINW